MDYWSSKVRKKKKKKRKGDVGRPSFSSLHSSVFIPFPKVHDEYTARSILVKKIVEDITNDSEEIECDEVHTARYQVLSEDHPEESVDRSFVYSRERFQLKFVFRNKIGQNVKRSEIFITEELKEKRKKYESLFSHRRYSINLNGIVNNLRLREISSYKLTILKTKESDEELDIGSIFVKKYDKVDPSTSILKVKQDSVNGICVEGKLRNMYYETIYRDEIRIFDIEEKKVVKKLKIEHNKRTFYYFKIENVVIEEMGRFEVQILSPDNGEVEMSEILDVRGYY